MPECPVIALEAEAVPSLTPSPPFYAPSDPITSVRAGNLPHAPWTVSGPTQGRPRNRPRRGAAASTEPADIQRVADPEEVWSPILEPGLALLNGTRRDLRLFHHELAQFQVHRDPGTVLWCDAAHAFDPYIFAELNLVRGFQADDGAERVLVKRCMTPFQWDSVLTQHLDDKLYQTDASIAIAAPYDALFSTDELSDWEQEDYVRFSIRHLRDLSRKHRVPVLAGVDMTRWWRTHPGLARTVYEAVHERWTVTTPGGRFRAVRESDGLIVDPRLRKTVTLLDFMQIDEPLPKADQPHGERLLVMEAGEGGVRRPVQPRRELALQGYVPFMSYGDGVSAGRVQA